MSSQNCPLNFKNRVLLWKLDQYYPELIYPLDLQIQFTSDIQGCADKILSTSSNVQLPHFNSTLSRME